MNAERVKVDQADDRAALASILNELAVDADESSDRSRARRVVGDVVAAWPGSADDRWMLWASEGGQSLGRPARIVDCSPEQAIDLAHHGSAVIARPRGVDSWIAFVGGDTSRVRCLQPTGHPPSALIKRRQAVRMLRKLSDSDIVRFVVLDTTHLHAADHSPDHDSHDESPFKRYWSLLAPESLDILTVLAFAIVTGLLAMATPLAVESLVSTVAFGRLLQPVVLLALILFGFLSFSAALRALQIFVVEIIQRRMFARIAASLAFRLPRAQVQALENHYAPELVNRFFEVVTVQKVTAMLLLDGIALVISTLVGMAVLALYHPWLLGFDVVLLALITFTIFVLGRGAVKTSINESKAKYRTASWLEDIAACPTAFRYDGAAEFALERADHHIFDYLSARKKHFRILIRQMLFSLALQAVAGTVLLGLGGWLVISGQLTLGQLVAAELIVAVIVGSFTKLGKHLENFYDVVASVDKLGHLFDIPVERQDGQLTLPEGEGLELRLSGVGYRYASGAQGLAPIDWEVEPGSRWAVTGADGCGKSTLVDLIYGLRQPSQGTLAMNGVSPRELRPDVLRRDVALARGIEIFGGSIAENVHLMRPDLSLADVHEALELAGLLDDVLAYPAGIDTVLITGDGRPLTQGRLHRLMMARAVIGRPRLFLIDGTLDALPDDEAAAIVRRLIDPARSWTVIVATTRNATADLFPKRMELSRAPHGRTMRREMAHAH